jgi:predicted deacylase
MSVSTLSTKQRGFLPVPGTDIQLPFTDIRGTDSGPTLLVTGGVHGGEYPGIESAIRFAASLDSSRLRGRVKVIHMTNPPAFYAKRQYVSPLDDKNLNRVFPGNIAGTPTERVAAVVIEALREADFWVDLHGGDIHEALVPFTIFSDRGPQEVVRQAEAMARAYGIPHILRSSSIAGGSYAAAAELGVPAILTESGQVGQLEEAAVAIHLNGLEQLLRHLGIVAQSPSRPIDAPLLTQFAWISSPATGLYYSSLKPGQEVRQGETGGVVKDAFGDIIADVPIPQDGVVLFTVTSLAINAGEPLFAVAAP